MAELSPYERELEEQPAALRRCAGSPLPPQLAGLRLAGYPRIILTGMGSSHFAAVPLWRALVGAGYPAWWISTTQLLDSRELVTADSLVIMTSQSGRSGEVVAAVDGSRLARPRTLIGVTNDPRSPLGEAADICMELRSGLETTVSAKSYLNTLAAHRRLAAALTGGDPAAATSEILQAAADLAAFDCVDVVAKLARATVDSRSPRVALIGKGNDTATALLGGLILKEAAKVAAEGYIGGEFRHGPLELAGPGLTAVIFAGGAGGAGAGESGRGGAETEQPVDQALGALALELAGTGSEVVVVGGRQQPGITHIPLPAHGPLRTLVLAAKATQVLSVELARAGGRLPGEFLFGQKITATL